MARRDTYIGAGGRGGRQGDRGGKPHPREAEGRRAGEGRAQAFGARRPGSERRALGKRPGRRARADPAAPARRSAARAGPAGRRLHCGRQLRSPRGPGGLHRGAAPSARVPGAQRRSTVGIPRERRQRSGPLLPGCHWKTPPQGVSQSFRGGVPGWQGRERGGKAAAGRCQEPGSSGPKAEVFKIQERPRTSQTKEEIALQRQLQELHSPP